MNKVKALSDRIRTIEEVLVNHEYGVHLTPGWRKTLQEQVDFTLEGKRLFDSVFEWLSETRKDIKIDYRIMLAMACADAVTGAPDRRLPRDARSNGTEAPEVDWFRGLEAAKLPPNELRHLLNFLIHELRGRLADAETDTARRQALATCAARIDDAEEALFHVYSTPDDTSVDAYRAWLRAGCPR